MLNAFAPVQRLVLFNALLDCWDGFSSLVWAVLLKLIFQFSLLRDQEKNPVVFEAFHPLAPTHLSSLLICSPHMPIAFLFLCFNPHCSLCLECLSLASFLLYQPLPFFKPHLRHSSSRGQKVCDWSDLSLYLSHGICLNSSLVLKPFVPLSKQEACLVSIRTPSQPFAHCFT